MLDELQMEASLLEGATLVEGTGCVDCNNTGYRGRAGVYEVMAITPTLRDRRG